jgi:hypothetical protein
MRLALLHVKHFLIFGAVWFTGIAIYAFAKSAFPNPAAVMAWGFIVGRIGFIVADKFVPEAA